MSVHTKCSNVLKKLNDLEKVAISLEKELIIERFSCKRCIKQNNMPAAITKARRCVELRKQSQLYFSICRRVRIFIEEVNFTLEQKDKPNKELIHLVNPIVEGVNSLNFGLIELYLESFEKHFGEDIKQQMKEIEIVSYLDTFKKVSETEIEKFLHEMGSEAKEDEKAFMYKRGSLVEDFMVKKPSKESGDPPLDG